MHRSTTRSRPRRWLAGAAILATLAGLLAMPVGVAAEEPSDMVLDWNANAIAVIGAPVSPPVTDPPTPSGLGQGPPIGAFHLAMVQAAIYDAVMAIDPTNAPYLAGLTAPAGASKDAAIAQAGHDVLIGLAASASQAVRDRIDAMLVGSLAGVPSGTAKTQGIVVGAAAAAALLAARVDDGRFGSATWQTGTGVGAWRLVPPANANVQAWFADVEPLLIDSSGQFRTRGPLDITGKPYAKEFDEVKAKGAQTGSSRTQAEDLLASFVSANPTPYMNQGLREIAVAEALSTNEQARLFAMTTMTGADALIGCWDDKRYWSFWRPQTAIQLAADDGNPWTEADPAWLALYPNPGYPDHPSGYNCYSGATWHSARLFFGSDKMAFSLTSPGTAPLTNITREYTRFTDVIDDTIDGRIYTGFHFRTPDAQGAWLGEQVARWSAKHAFAALN